MADFAKDLLLGALGDGPPVRNLSLSPLGVRSTLVSAVMGSAGETREELLKVAVAVGAVSGVRDHNALLEVAEKDRTALLDKAEKDPAVTLLEANSAWIAANRTVSRTYADKVNAMHGCDTRVIAPGGDAAARAVNDWVSERTEGNITKIVDASDLPIDTTTAVLANAVHFAAPWSVRFDKDCTGERAFHAPGGVVEAQFMCARREIVRMPDYLSAHLSFAGSCGLYMQLTLPSSGSDIATAIATGCLGNDDKAGTREGAEIYVPRFRVGGGRVGLRGALMAMGARRAFSGDDADFSNLCSPSAGVCISDVLHQAVVEIDEDGARASAASVAVCVDMCPPKRIVFDRPFAFAIRARGLDVPLFVGVVADPTRG